MYCGMYGAMCYDCVCVCDYVEEGVPVPRVVL